MHSRILSAGRYTGQLKKEGPQFDPGLQRSPGEWIGYPLQYSGLENSVDYTVHGVKKSQTRLSNSLSPVFLPGKITWMRSLVGYSPWGRKELDTTEAAKHMNTF